MYRTTCQRCGSHYAYVRVYRGPGLSRYVSVPLGLLCLVGMIVGGLGWMAEELLALGTATATLFLEVGVASILFVGLLMFAELQARRSRGAEGFCGGCGHLWTRPPSQRVHTWNRGTSRSPQPPKISHRRM